jgi:hypothetical protein
LLHNSSINHSRFKLNKNNYYTHYDLTLAKELGFEIELIHDNEFNFYYYSKEKLIKGKLLFGQFVSKLYDLKSNKIDGAKDIMNALWGSLSQRNKYNKIITNDTELTIPDQGEIIGFSCTRAGDLKIKYNSNKNKLFKRDEGRWSCFFTSFTRMQIARQLQPYTNNIVRIQTDGFIVNINCWSNDFLQYDYIGAPWVHGTLPNTRVGNGGFSLRSKKFIERCSASDIAINSNQEDIVVCSTNKHIIEQSDLKYAPVEVAAKFSWGGDIPEIQRSWKDCFGAHCKIQEFLNLIK